MTFLKSSKMASVLLNVLCFTLSIIASVSAAGEFDVLHSPDSLKFSGHDQLQQSLLKEVFSAAVGLSVEEGSDWAGLSISDPFNTPEAIVAIYVNGVSSLVSKAHLKGHRYSLETDENDTYKELEHRIQQRFTEGGNNIVNIAYSQYEEKMDEYVSIFGQLKNNKISKKTYNYLKPDLVGEDEAFLQELEFLNTITEKVESGAVGPDDIVDLYYVEIESLHALSDFHGPHSPETNEAKALLGSAIIKLKTAFVNAYDGSVLVSIITSDASHTRRSTRAVKEGEEAVAKWKVSKEYGVNYPVMFNIFLWFGIVMVFSLLAVVYAIMDMDPGRDSIIYRMTSNRMKKDN